ncbi:MAG: FtsW/RodA/SpoVE family cell cycle protein, partial [Pseudomonadota bacterium]|nr:FtsW/RodA/SpoVE family cell cycle protein [Pseudomonadota bacterium]
MTDYVRQLPPHQFVQRKRVSEWVRVDLLSLFLISLIATYGLVILMSAVDQNMARVQAQVIRIIVAFSVMVVMAQIPPRLLLRLAPALYLLGLLLLFLVFLVGTESKGATRWLRIGPIGFQPSELMKLALPMVLAWYFHDRRLPPRPRHVGIATLIIAVPVLLIYPQPDLGTSILVAASGLLVLFLAGISWRYIFSLIGLFLVSAPGLWFVMTDYQRGRILTLIDPERDPLGSG